MSCPTASWPTPSWPRTRGRSPTSSSGRSHGPTPNGPRAIPRSLCPSPTVRLDVQVAPEDVLRVVAILDLGEAFEVHSVGGARDVFAAVVCAEIADVPARGGEALHGGERVPGPGDVVVGRVAVEPDGRREEAVAGVAMRNRGCGDGDPGYLAMEVLQERGAGRGWA